MTVPEEVLQTKRRPPQQTAGRSGRLVEIAGVVTVALLLIAVAFAGRSARTEPGKDGARPAIVEVDGHQIPIDAGAGAYRMRGALIGDWNMLTAQMAPGYSETDAPWTIVQTGRERFVGCVDRDRSRHCDNGDPSGVLHFDYMLRIRYEPNGSRSIGGSCVHQITSGSGGFEGTRGAVIMDDERVGRQGATRTAYRGEIVLHAVPNDRGVSISDSPAPFRARPTGC